MFKNFKNKKAASMMMVLGYSTVLFGLSGLLIGMLISSQRFVGISEKYNMAIYAAESGIEQALFEINVHDIGFNDSTEKPDTDGTPKQQNGVDIVDGFLQLNGERLKYKWGVKGLNETDTEIGYLTRKGNIKYDYLKDDVNSKYYKDFRKFYMFEDTGLIGEDPNITNICQTDSTIINLTTSGSNIFTDSDSEERNIVQWRLEFNEVESGFDPETDETGTGYYLESNAICEGNKKDPFCYTNTKTDYTLQFNSTDNIGNCFNSFGDECHEQEITNMLAGDDYPILSGNQAYKPELTISYQNKLFENGDIEENGIPIKYEISGCTSANFPSLVQEIESTAQTYGSVQKISTKIYQGDQGINLSYTIIQ